MTALGGELDVASASGGGAVVTGALPTGPAATRASR
jgi:hypothetical protein